MPLTNAIYGTLPGVIREIDLSPKEMMFWLYCPIKLAGEETLKVPDNLSPFNDITFAALEDYIDVEGMQDWIDSYMYITAKTLWVSPDNPGNRPGWHSDGFLTNDMNYVWSDSNPTVFYYDGMTHAFEADHSASLAQMDALCEADPALHHRYPNKTLLRLDQRVLHKVDTNIEPGIRTFVKISISKHIYALQGNSINHGFEDWKNEQERLAERNCPITG